MQAHDAITMLMLFLSANAAAIPIDTIPEPELNDDSWIMLEIWPEVEAITLAAYFLDYSSEKNQSLCEAAKRVFDREQQTQAERQGRKLTSYRLCLSVSEARSQGYLRG